MTFYHILPGTDELGTYMYAALSNWFASEDRNHWWQLIKIANNYIALGLDLEYE